MRAKKELLYTKDVKRIQNSGDMQTYTSSRKGRIGG